MTDHNNMTYPTNEYKVKVKLMLRSLLRAYTTAFLFALRKYVNITTDNSNQVYEQIYLVPEINARYIIRVTEHVFKLKPIYCLFGYKRKIYHAVLRYTREGHEDIVFDDSYPQLALGIYLDPLYPLSLVAAHHVNLFLAKEKL